MREIRDRMPSQDLCVTKLMLPWSLDSFTHCSRLDLERVPSSHWGDKRSYNMNRVIDLESRSCERSNRASFHTRRVEIRDPVVYLLDSLSSKDQTIERLNLIGASTHPIVRHGWEFRSCQRPTVSQTSSRRTMDDSEQDSYCRGRRRCASQALMPIVRETRSYQTSHQRNQAHRRCCWWIGVRWTRPCLIPKNRFDTVE